MELLMILMGRGRFRVTIGSGDWSAGGGRGGVPAGYSVGVLTLSCCCSAAAATSLLFM